jgi:hypothetical protein
MKEFAYTRSWVQLLENNGFTAKETNKELLDKLEVKTLFVIAAKNGI